MADSANKVINKSSTVAIEYIVNTTDGEVVCNNTSKDPFVFQLGDNVILPAIEQLLINHKEHDVITTTLPPESAYGHIDNTAFRSVNVGMLPEECRHQGALANIEDDYGDSYQVRVHSLDNTTATLDFNHPLAGKTLNITITILSVD